MRPRWFPKFKGIGNEWANFTEARRSGHRSLMRRVVMRACSCLGRERWTGSVRCIGKWIVGDLNSSRIRAFCLLISLKSAELPGSPLSKWTNCRRENVEEFAEASMITREFRETLPRLTFGDRSNKGLRSDIQGRLTKVPSINVRAEQMN